MGMINLFTPPEGKGVKLGRFDTHALKLMREGVVGFIEKTPWEGKGVRPAQQIVAKMDAQIECLDRDSKFDGKLEMIPF